MMYCFQVLSGWFLMYCFQQIEERGWSVFQRFLILSFEFVTRKAMTCCLRMPACMLVMFMALCSDSDCVCISVLTFCICAVCASFPEPEH